MTGTARLVVGSEHTAAAVGSGDVAALATPWLVALCEQACRAEEIPGLGEDETTVGVRVELDHIHPAPVGAVVAATATILSVTNRSVTYSVEATLGSITVGRGTMVRVRVPRESFVAGVEQS